MRIRRRRELVLLLLLLSIAADLIRCEGNNSTHPLAPSPSQSPKNTTKTLPNHPPAQNTTKGLDHDLSAPTNETNTTTEAPVPPSGSSNDHCCGSKVVACLSAPGDASNGILSLDIKSRDSVKVKIITPGFLQAEPAEFTTNGQDVQVKVEMVDAEAAKLEPGSNITIQSEAGSCQLPVPSQNLGYSKDQFSYSTLRSPAVGFGMLALALVLVLGFWAYYRYKVKNRGRNDGTYVELEMGLHDQTQPAANNNPASNNIGDDWDEVWDEDWGDSKKSGGSSQFKMTESLSSKGLAARKTAKEWTD